MRKKEKVHFVIDKLEELYPNPPIPLNHRDEYTLLIAVLLSAQCTDKRVNKTTPKLFELADTPEKMVERNVKEIEDIIRPCGLAPRKSQNIYDLSKILLEEHEGEVPREQKELEKLPGVGAKTAQVVMCQAFEKPAFPVDTHIHRLMYRWTLSPGRSVKKTEKDAKRLFPKEKWTDLHLQIIYFGREYCPARGHDPKECPICKVVGRKSMF